MDKNGAWLGFLIVLSLILLLLSPAIAEENAEETPDASAKDVDETYMDSSTESSETTAEPGSFEQEDEQGDSPEEPRIAATDLQEVIPMPEKPKAKEEPIGSFETDLQTGAAIYTYPLDVPPGVNGHGPSLTLIYNSQGGCSGFMPLSWSLAIPYIWRDVNFTPEDPSDDVFRLSIAGGDELVEISPSNYKTKHDRRFKIEFNDDRYWTAISKDGTIYRFGHNDDSEAASKNREYISRWYLDRVEDSSGNAIIYEYLEDPFEGDIGTNYLSEIRYANAEISFDYLQRTAYPQYIEGSKVHYSHVLSEISMIVSGERLRRYSLESSENAACPLLDSIVLDSVGEDYTPRTVFEYNEPVNEFEESEEYAPPVSLSSMHTSYMSVPFSNGTRLVDINHDGLPDIVKAIQYPGRDTHEAWINTGSGWERDDSFAPPQEVFFEVLRKEREHYVILDQGVRIFDVNGDGRNDLVQGYRYGRDGYKRSWINTGSGWERDDTYAPPEYFMQQNPSYMSSPASNGTRLADLNGDGLQDMIRAVGQYHGAWINTGSGWERADDFILPNGMVFEHIKRSARGHISFISNGVELVDLNKDGLSDILRGFKQNNEFQARAWLNTGSGWERDDSFSPPIPLVTYYTSHVPRPLRNGTRIIDINSDGLPDLLRSVNSNNPTKEAWINTGSGWERDDSFSSPEGFVFEDVRRSNRYRVIDWGVNVIDLNGDGIKDYVKGFSNQNEGLHGALLGKGERPYLLSKIENPHGGSIVLQYSGSSDYQNSFLPISIAVISKTIEENGISNEQKISSETAYSYEGGLYDYEDREFRGFSKVTISDSDSISVHRFHQDDAKKGKERLLEVFDSEGKLLREESKTWADSFEGGIYDVKLTLERRREHGDKLFVTEISYTYDDYGNILRAQSFGDTDKQGDERIIITDYHYDETNWIMDRPSHELLLGFDGETLSEVEYSYDERGLLTEERSVCKPSCEDSITSFEYDEHGNLVSTTDSLGRTDRIEYDEHALFPKASINALGQRTEYTYDAFGNLLSATDPNGIQTSYTYDGFGRVLKERLPYDSSAEPSKEYVYNFDGSAPESLITMQKTGPDYLEHYSFVDGFGNVIQTRRDAENGGQIVTDYFYDSKGRPSGKSRPYLSSYSREYTSGGSSADYSYSYDSLDRITEIVNPDGTKKRIDYNTKSIDVTDENGNKKTYKFDAYDNIKAVIEENRPDDYVTGYTYDTAGRLLKIKDSQGNEFKFEYDSLGRKISQEDPDLGRWTYEYDSLGNMIRQIDSKGQQTIFDYDELGRLKQTEYSGGSAVEYTYDSDKIGMLSRVEGQGYSKAYRYDDRLRKTYETVTVGDKLWQSAWSYDSADRLIWLNSPISNVKHSYNKQGELDSIEGVVDNIDYNAENKITKKELSNGIRTEISYDESSRIERIYSPGLQDLRYDFDGVGNIIEIDDRNEGTKSNFAYDDLNRLVAAVGDYFDLEYEYDSIGNLLLLRGDEEVEYVFEGNIVHAPSGIRQLQKDMDGDGYDETVDCNDNDATVHPGAKELNDGIDQNCVNDAPLARFGYSGNQRISFSNEAYDLDGKLQYKWYFGDGTVSRDKSPVHDYSPGKYTVSLIVYDKEGKSDIHSEKITIKGNEVITLSKDSLKQGETFTLLVNSPRQGVRSQAIIWPNPLRSKGYYGLMRKRICGSWKCPFGEHELEISTKSWKPGKYRIYVYSYANNRWNSKVIALK